MKKFDVELCVGLFMILGILCLGYLSIKLGKLEVLGSRGYEVEAVFSNGGGIKSGSTVVIAGVEIGRVKKVTLDDYQALVVMDLAPSMWRSRRMPLLPSRPVGLLVTNLLRLHRVVLKK